MFYMLKRLRFLLVLLLVVLTGSPVYATQFTVGSFASLPASPSIQDIAYGIQENRWLVYDGSNWIPCENGSCGLAMLPFCHPSFTTSIGVLHAAANDGLIVAGVPGKKVYICGGRLISSGTVSVKLIRSSGSTCAGADSNLEEASPLTAQVGYLITPGQVTAAGDSLCINLNAAVSVTGWVLYRQQP